MSEIINWDSLEIRTMLPGLHARFYHSATMTYVLWNIDQDALLPEHSHPHEQVVHMLEGRFNLMIDGITYALKPGDMVTIPSNTMHSGKAITGCRILDTFYPKREDYIF